MTYLLLILGFVFLIKGADLLVDGASAIAHKFHISNLVIGLTIVAFGTSMPELFVNITACLKNTPQIAIGNILGSNIANTLLILGIAAMIYPLKVTHSTVWKEIPLSLLAALMIGLMANDIWLDYESSNILSRIDGFALLAFFTIFLYYSFTIAKQLPLEKTQESHPTFSTIRSTAMIVLGLAGLALGGKWIVDSAITIAQQFHISESLIGLTIVAIGTSMPELATSAMAALKKNPDIAVGNVVGSNIFNIFFILGTSATISPLPLQPSNQLDIGITILASVLLFIFMFTLGRKKVDRLEGALFLTLYIGYIAYLIIKNKA